MTDHFAIQARLVEWRDGAVVRDDTRRGTATALDDALREAGAHIADGFTAWIYRVEAGSATTSTYTTITVLRPGPATHDPSR